MNRRYTEQELSDIFFESMDMFNECLDSDISRSNTIIEFFTPENGIKIYEAFYNKHFQKNLSEDYLVDGYFDSFAAQAFVSDHEYGVLIRADIDFTLAEVLQTFLHEISHLFCTRNEIDEGHFFDRYCMGSEEEDGMINAGYAIWRETVADIMADSVLSENATMTLAMVKPEVKHLYELIDISNPDSKKCVSLILAYIMISREVACTTDWNVAKAAIDRLFNFDNSMMMVLLEMIFDKLHKSPFWVITPEFIRDFGCTYISLLSFKRLQSLK